MDIKQIKKFSFRLKHAPYKYEKHNGKNFVLDLGHFRSNNSVTLVVVFTMILNLKK